MKKTKIRNAGLFMATLVILLPFSSFAVLTPVYAPPAGEEPHAKILGDIYSGGTSFIGTGTPLNYAVWSQYTSADNSIIAYRVDDALDQIWNTDCVVSAKAKYAGQNQSFGWDEGALNGTNYNQLLTDADIILGTNVLVNTGEVSFLWGLKSTGSMGNYLWWSKTSLNYDGKDHMVTYRIEGLNTDCEVYLLFFEDLPKYDYKGHTLADWDYNDFVVEICQIPEPASIALLGLGVIISMLKRRGS